MKTKNEIINYGISRNYLNHWGVNEALREIMQNFMDFGEYEVTYGRDHICISNEFTPEDLTFLALGKSVKSNGSRGKYGEGLKMALLIFARENYDILIQTSNKTLRPSFVETSIGETFAIEVEDGQVVLNDAPFTIHFKLPLDIWETFFNNIIKEKDIIFDDNYYGKIVDKEKGNIYCGGLFVCNVKNLSKSYDINTTHLPLTRDRSLPQTLDVNWTTSKINSAHGKLSVTDLSFSDTVYVEKIPEEVKKEIVPKLVGNSIEAVYQHEGKDVVIKNENVKQLVLKDNFFEKAVRKLRNYLLDKVGVYEMLVQFRDKHIYSGQAKDEFNIILEKLKNK